MVALLATTAGRFAPGCDGTAVLPSQRHVCAGQQPFLSVSAAVTVRQQGPGVVTVR